MEKTTERLRVHSSNVSPKSAVFNFTDAYRILQLAPGVRAIGLKEIAPDQFEAKPLKTLDEAKRFFDEEEVAHHV